MSSPKTKRNRRLSPEEWAELGERILNGDQKAYDKLVLDYQPLMRKIAWDIARKFDSSNNGNNLIEELLAEGTVALCEAARNWDHKKCWLFSKYAQQWIWGRVMDAVGRSELIARTTKDTRNAQTLAMLSTETVINTSKKRNGRDVTLGETLEDENTIPPHEYVEAREELKKARDQIDALRATVVQECASRQRNTGPHKKIASEKAFMSLYGIDTHDRSPQWGIMKKQKEVGAILGVSDESVRQTVMRIWKYISHSYTLGDLQRDIAIIIACREVELA